MALEEPLDSPMYDYLPCWYRVISVEKFMMPHVQSQLREVLTWAIVEAQRRDEIFVFGVGTKMADRARRRGMACHQIRRFLTVKFKPTSGSTTTYALTMVLHDVRTYRNYYNSIK